MNTSSVASERMSSSSPLPSDHNSYSQILTMAIFMFIVTFSVGYLPTKIPASPRLMNLISLFGAGLLVGAALIIIVPEGMSVLYQSMIITTANTIDEG